jgi:thioesterase domain-containing protein
MPLPDPAAGWAGVIPGVDVIQIPGGHFSALQGDNLRVVSEKIRACLPGDQG